MSIIPKHNNDISDLNSDGLTILKISNTYVETSSTIATGGSSTVTATISRTKSSSSILLFQRYGGWCAVSSLSISSSTLSVTFLNASPSAHSGSANIGWIEYE